ncbi:glycoside hydrolase family 3 N-terminal domain-containing protein [Microbacterium yannicii]|uniref:beta-glucosidase n=1 Tax=Microbacterium yannicii TaxID=671622 RepID=A0ABP9MAY1_9MICO|nr:glycoside hydrolase family 3 N-terminal domain-containing protein [Microbacterium yannicii]MCO5952437.1 glycoside hydrolase family 3 protein [Microbacterium yannicii]
MTLETSLAPDVRRRAQEVVAGLSGAEVAGLLFHPIVVLDADHDPDASSPFGPSTRELIVERGIRHFCLATIPSPAQTAPVIGRLQEIATSHGSRLPIVFSTDPRHSFLQNMGATHRAEGVSQWPEPIAFGALDDPDLVREFARIVRDDYRAMGIRMALHPQVDLTTEPRWARQAQSFGADPALTSRLLAAFLEGLQGPALGAESVAATVKHFPGGGPQKDGEDPHFAYGREQVYPGGRFEDHLLPFRTAISSGAAAIMPYYGMPVGLTRNGQAVEEVGFAFNRALITDLLRDELGFEGLVLSDFGLVHDAVVFGKPFPARAWGVEHLDPGSRIARLLSAGVDQLGGESDTALLLSLLEEGRVSLERVQDAAVRVVELNLRLTGDAGNPPSTPDPADLPLREHVELGMLAQSRSITVLQNGLLGYQEALPLDRPLSAYLRGIDPSALPDGWSVAEPAQADVAIVRLAAPFEPRDHFFLESGMEQGSLEFAPAVVDELRTLAAQTALIIAVTLSRPAILTQIAEFATAIIADYGASDEALLDALTGVVTPEGRLPFELPRSMAAVAASRPDVAGDTHDPLYPAGWRVTLEIPSTSE